MDQQDVTYYLTAVDRTGTDTAKKIIESCEAVDLSGSDCKVFYNGVEGFGPDVKYDFEVKPAEALNKSEEYIHSNFTLLEWQNDELLTETAELLEEINEKSKFKVDSISLLIGPHEILSLEDNTVIQSTFSLAFYSESPLAEDAADLNLRMSKDKDLAEKISILEQICQCKLKGFLGGS